MRSLGCRNLDSTTSAQGSRFLVRYARTNRIPGAPDQHGGEEGTESVDKVSKSKGTAWKMDLRGRFADRTSDRKMVVILLHSHSSYCCPGGPGQSLHSQLPCCRKRCRATTNEIS